MKTIVFLAQRHQFRLLAFASLLVIYVLSSEQLAYVLCPMQHLFALPCPACGMTRSLNALLHFQINSALHWHPLGPVILSAIVITLFKNNTRYLDAKLHQGLTVYHVLFVLFIMVWLYRLLIF
jgi:hypothetical protein